MAVSTKKDVLPDYECPPVVETVLGVQFDRLSRFKNAHLGAFWRTLNRNEWPVVADAQQLASQFERFTKETKWARGAQLQLTQIPACRLQIRNKNSDRMIQVQNTRLHFNWLGNGGANYPRYEKVREGFEKVLRDFISFIDQEEVGEYQPNQWEVTYVNHIPQGTVWVSPSDWNFFQPLASVPTIENLIQGESFSGEWHFIIPNQRGRLHVQWQHGLGTEDQQENQEFIRLTLTARGSLTKDADVEGVLEGLDLGRETIVRFFKNSMNDKANKHWGLKNARD